MCLFYKKAKMLMVYNARGLVSRDKEQRRKKMIGIILTYIPKDATSRTLINHELFGRNMYTNRGGNKVAYYQPGMLHNVRFSRLLPSKIFVERDIFNELNKSILSLYGSIYIESAERDEDDLNLKTGEKYWEVIAKEKGYYFKKCIRGKYNDGE